MNLGERIGRALGRRRPARQLAPEDILRRELGRAAEEFDLSDLIAVLVPRTFSETGHWPGPIYRLAAGDFDQTWAVLRPDNALVYVSRAMQALWESRGEPWRDIADQNLRRLAEAEPFSHVCTREDGSTYMAVMNYGQNLAASRLLVPGLLQTTFPEGYLVAVPEMTCAVAFSARPNEHEAQEIDGLISRLFENGSEPVSLLHYSPTALWEVASSDLGLRD